MADLVVDASLASAWCFPDEQREYANTVLRAVSSSTVITIAPSLWAYEVRNSVLMGFRRGRISGADAEAFLDSLAGLDIGLAEPVSYDAVFKLAVINGLTVYDAAYLELAIRRNAQLASLDKALQRAAVKTGVGLFAVPTRK